MQRLQLDISTPSLAAIVLAGGHSSRMGHDKALLPVAGVPMLQRVCQIALQCTPIVSVITPWGDRYRSILPAECHLIGEEWLVGQTHAHGPLLGFAQALATVRTEWVLLLACDLPYLQAPVLQASLRSLPTDAATIACLPKTSRGWEPLCGFYRTRCQSSLDRAIARGERSFQGWLADEPVAVLPISDPRMLLNCNTPADLHHAQASASRDRERGNSAYE